MCHHVYPGNVTDRDELPAYLGRITRLLDAAAIQRETVTLVLDKGSAALANTLELQASGLGWIAALPWDQAPAGFAAEQCHSVTLSLAKATQKLRALARQIRQPQDRHTEPGLRRRIQRWLRPNFVAQALSYELQRTADGSWDLQFAIEEEALNRLLTERFGRTTLVTNRLDWSAAEVATAYNGQQHVERVFRGLKGGDWLGWGPLYHWTDSKIRVHAFCCLLGVSLLQYLYQKAQIAWPMLSMEGLKHELGQIQRIDLLYPPLGAKGP